MNDKAKFYPGEQVEVLSGGYRNKKGEVINDDGRKVEVKIGGFKENFDEGNLKLSQKISKEQAIEAVKQLKEKVDKIPKLPDREKGELPTHLEYLKEDIEATTPLRQKLIRPNFDYVDKTLEVIRKTGSSANCWEEIEPNLNKIRGWLKTSL